MPLRFRAPVLMALTAVVLASCARNRPAPKPAPTPVPRESAEKLPMDAASLKLGEHLFTVHCAFCHGPHGEGAKGPTLAQPALPRAGDDASLLRIIREGIGGTEMPRARLERPESLQVAAYVRSLGARPMETVPGDAQHGAELYATKGACAQCHTLRGYGGAVGPDLTDIGRRRSSLYLRRALLDPGAEVPQSFSAYRGDGGLPENFLYVRVVTPDGAQFAGVRVNEDTFSIQIRDLRGQVHSFFKSDLAELHKDYGASPMPSYAVLSTNEVNDLVAYLVSLRADK